MRFPFTFMGLFSLALGAWVAWYLALHPATDPVLFGLEIVPAVALFAFGAYVLYRRLWHGRAA